MQELAGLRVLVTRPAPQGRVLADWITTRGGQATFFPTIDFVLRDVSAELRQLAEQEWIIFTSPQAVAALNPKVLREITSKIAAIGAGTAKALTEAGITVTLYPTAEWNSEGLLALPEFTHVTDQKIAIIRGIGGRELLDKALAERGATVLSILAYERILPKFDVSPVQAAIREHHFDCIITTSATGVENLLTLIGPPLQKNVLIIPLFVVSERIKILAEQLGFRTIVVIPTASNEAIIEALIQRKEVL